MSENEKKQTPAAAAADDENHIIAERRAKLAKLREEGVAYPNDFVRKDLFGDLRAEHGEKTREELDEAAIEVAVSGRMMLKRVMGKAAFATVRDFTTSATKPMHFLRASTWATSSLPRARFSAPTRANSQCASRSCA